MGGLQRGVETMESDVTGEVVVAWVRVAMGISMALVLATGAEMEHHPAAAWPVLLGAIAYSWVALWRVRREAAAGDIRPSTSSALTALDAGFIIALTGLTGGTGSPMLPILVVVVISQALRSSSLSRAVSLGGLTALALVPVLLAGPDPGDASLTDRIRLTTWWAWMLVAGAVLAGALSDAVGRAQARRSQAEASAVDEHRRLDQEQSLRRRLESVDEAKTDFLRSLAHDFRTPIASLEALAEALDWAQHPLSPAQRTEVIGLIQTHARHLTGMLAEVRDVAVAESLGPGPNLEVADVFVPELIRTAATAAGLAPERLVSSVEPGLALLRTDTRKITRILTNLLDNASRHSPPEQPVEVQVSLRHGDYVEISILDRGSGIPPEMATRVFDKFAGFGEHRSTGLGMWIVAQFVASLDGEVSLENRPDGGLAVRVRLPAEACFPLGDGGDRLRRSAGDVTV